LEQERLVYQRAFPGDARLRWLLDKQKELVGSVSGAKFSRPGGRASGDFNTGLGNSLIFLVECVSAMRELGVPYDILVDGDNALLFVKTGDLSHVVQNFAPLVERSSGHEVKLEAPTTTIERIRFGGAAPIFLGPRLGWSMVRDWVRVLSGAFSSHVHLNEPKFAKRWMYGVARCELSVARGVPILQEWAVKAIQALRTGKKLKEDFFLDYFAQGAWFADEGAATVVTLDARISFEKAFGVDVDSQLRFERGFNFDGVSLPEQQYTPKRFFHWLDEVGVHEHWR
jgi:hypothetical protein